MLFAFDSSGVEAAVLCVLACSALMAVIFTGFALSSRSRRPASEGRPAPSGHPDELGVMALWRLEREVRAGRDIERMPEAKVEEVARSDV